MTREKFISILDADPISSNLHQVLAISREKARTSHRFFVNDHAGEKTSRLPAHHFFKVFTFRMKNPNGVAKNTPGFPDSADNFADHPGSLELIIAELDGGSSISLWISENKTIIGCLYHPEGSDARL